MKRSYKNIARVVRPHGKNGEVLVRELRGLPFLLQEGESYCLTPPALKRPRWAKVQSLRELADGCAVKFEGYDNIDDAEELRGKTVLADADGLDLGIFDIAYDELVGRSVVDAEHGDLGSITEVMETPAHDVWVVNGAYGEVLIPVVEELVQSIPEEGSILVDLPAGLVEEG